jgi:hypothetical protein
MKYRISIRFEDWERYVVSLNKSVYKTLKDFVVAVWAKFGIKENPEYVMLIEPVTIVTDLNQIEHNDRWRLVKKDQISVIVKEEVDWRLKAMDERARIISSGKWEDLKNNQKNKFKFAKALLGKSDYKQYDDTVKIVKVVKRGEKTENDLFGDLVGSMDLKG